ncbi:MAG: DNA helicase RecQ [Phycisphaerales bacterium]|nr:DNA helicase RecQ [Phycisphaerales bacterium]
MTTRNATSDLPPALHKAVRDVWGFDTLRPLQAEAVAAALAGRDALIVLPTGGGKSLCFQAPPLVTGSLTVVVSPLISLMKDQVDALRLNGYAAACLHSGCTAEEARTAREAASEGRLRLLYLAPERLLSEGFIEWLRCVRQPNGKAGVGAFAIDEAHCISHWGHDFRPEYRRLAGLRRWFPDACIHALTATATPRVREDIVAQLGLRDATVLVGTFDRPNLVYRIVPRVNREEQIAGAVERHRGEAVIVYCISRRDTEDVAGALRSRGVKAEAYHAGLDATSRRRVQDRFSRERIDVVVATVAFGMGIDRSNVRCVLHAAMPKSVEAYQQETGRAGRDGLEAECIMLFSGADTARWARLLEKSAAESGTAVEVTQAQFRLLDEMHRLCAGMKCRHRALSEHFGQAYPFPNCNACDVCLNEIGAVDDATTIARKIVSCVARIVQRSGFGFGAAHLVDVLRGSHAGRIVQRGHDQLSTFGLLRDVPRPTLMSYVNQLVDQGLLDRDDSGYGTLTLNEASRALLRGERTVSLLRPQEPATTREPREEIVLSPEEAGLFESLRDLRRTLADDRGVPPYVVFADSTLRELAAVRPGTMGALLGVRGIGERKAEEFGGVFIAHIREWSETHGLPLDARARRRSAPVQETAKPLSHNRRVAFDRFGHGDSVEAVAASLGLSPRTVEQYLVEWIVASAPGEVSAWVPPEVYERIAVAARECGFDRLKPIFDSLGGEVPYGQIRAVVAHLRVRGSSGDMEARPVEIVTRGLDSASSARR